MTESVTASADVEGVFRLMKDAFTDSTKVLLELMQNARRAGSPTVEIVWEPATQSLTVIDDGAGIDDFATLLTLAKSGWDSKMASEERAFGAGFWSAVHGCKRLHVESKGRGFIADTADILAFKQIPIYRCDQQRTVIRMLDLHRPMDNQSVFESAARGFPIPVLLNGQELARPDALDDAFESTSIGRVRLGTAPLAGITLYLQGFRVGESAGASRFNDDAPAVVHLDSTQFRARAPDRDCLVDGAHVPALVQKTVFGLWTRYYEALKAQGNTSALVEDAALLRRLGCLHLINDIPMIPDEFLERVQIEWFCDSDFGRDRPFTRALRREDAEQAVLLHVRAVPAVAGTLEPIRWGDELDFDLADFNLVQYLALHNAVVVSDGLDPGHWVYSLPNLIKERPSLESVEATDGAALESIDGHVIDHRFVACDAVTFRGSLGTVSSRAALALEQVDDGKPAIYVSAEAPLGTLVPMLGTFTDGNDQYQEDWYREDLLLLENRLAMARGGDPSELIAALLRRNLWSSTLGAIGPRTFTVRIDPAEASVLRQVAVTLAEA